MSLITLIPSTRVSDALIRQRLTVQIQEDQAELLRLQTAISTGRRIARPSDDAPAAQRGISLQSLLERKQQAEVNVTTSESFLNATDATLTGVAGLLAEIRGAALSVADNVTTAEVKRAVAEQVDRAIQQLMDAGNQKFRGRYLFAGSQASRTPFEDVDGYIRYNADDGQIESYADLEVLFATNASGEDVFGAFSNEVQSTVNLNPNLTAGTRLPDLLGGQGVVPASVAISDGATTSIVDLSSAATMGDVKALLEANPPTGRTITATITSTGLNIQLDGSSGIGLTIREVGGGTTAAELGIYSDIGVGVGPVVGSDLNPRLTKTTRLADLPLALDFASGLQIVNAGQTHTLSFASAQTVEDVLNVLNGSKAGLLAEINAAGTGINVRSRMSGGDFAIGENGGTTATDLGLRSFTAATQLEDLNHGFGVHTRDGDDFQIQLKNGTLLNIDVSAAETIGDVIALINTAGGGQVTAALSRFGNGIELTTSDTSTNAAFAVIKVLGTQAAEDLGLVPIGENQSSPAVAGGGVETITGRDVNPREVKGVFNSLVRLRQALQVDDLLQIDRSIELLDEAVLGMNFARAELGARQQALDLLQVRQDGERISLEGSLSEEIEIDFVDAVSELTARQAAFQASLQLSGRVLQITLLDYL